MEYFSGLINIKKKLDVFTEKKETYAFNNVRYLIKEYSRSANINKAELFWKEHKNKFINDFNGVIQTSKEIQKFEKPLINTIYTFIIAKDFIKEYSQLANFNSRNIFRKTQK